MTRVRAARLLDKNLHEKGRLHVQTQSVSINLTPVSTASMTLLERSSAQVRDFAEVYTTRGSAGIFRIVSKESGYGTGGDNLSLEHGICVLEDAVLPAEGKISGTFRDVIAALLAFQNAKIDGVAMWTLGQCEIPEEKKTEIEYQGDNTLAALISVLESIDGYALSFDQSGFPWVIDVKRMEDAPSCEGRMSRNINTARILADDIELCTRVECTRLEGGYMQLEDDPRYGIVSRRLEFADEIDDKTVIEECRRYLEARKAPLISIEIDGLDLSAVTGEKLDAFSVGKMMRLALAEYGVTINERIISINYAEAISRPEQVTITLCTAVRDAGTSIAGLSGSMSKLNSVSTKYGNRIRETEKSIVNLYNSAEGFTEIDKKIIHWFNEVEIDLDAEEAQIGALASRREVSENAVKINEAMLILNGDTEQGGSQAGLVSRVTKNEADTIEVSEALALFRTTTDSAIAQIGARVGDNEATISATATELGSRIDLKADKTYVDKLIADEVSAIRSEVGQLTGGTVQASHLYTQNLTATNTVRLGGYTCVWKKLDVVTDVSISKTYQTVPGGNGVDYVVIGGVSLDKTTEEIKYFGRD